jgi:hypothetical protein
MPLFSSGGSMYTTHAEEQAAKLRMEKNRPFNATHVYSPTGWDQLDPRGVVGEPIEPGSPVELMKEHTRGLHSGMPPPAKRMFNVVRDEQGNRQHVNKNSLDRGALFKDRRNQ